MDRNRILVTGCRGGAAGSGALHLGIRHPDVFNLVITGHPVIDYAAASRRTDRWARPLALSMQAVWGQADWNMKAEDGGSFWDRHNMIRAVKSLRPAADLPFITMTSNHGDADSRKFYELMLNRHAALMAEFSWGGTRYVPVSNTATFPNVIRLDIRKDKAYLACVSAGGMQLVTGGKMGDFNRHFRWRDVVDDGAKFEATLFLRGRGDSTADVAPRRLQRFKLLKGRTYAWSTKTTGRKGEPVEQTGEVQAEHNGVLTIPGVNIGGPLVVTAK